MLTKISAMPMQEGDPYPDWPEDAEVPPGQREVDFRMAAAEAIKGAGNELFKRERYQDALHKYNKARARPCTACLLKALWLSWAAHCPDSCCGSGARKRGSASAAWDLP